MYLNLVGFITGSSFERGVEGLDLSVVGNIVDLAQELDICGVDVPGVLEIQSGEDSKCFGLSISSLAASDGDVVESGVCKDGAILASLEGRSRQRNSESCEGDDGEGLEMHIE